MDYSIVVPAHNEEQSVIPLYEATKRVFDALGGVWELIVVDDGSTDGTYAALSGLADADSRVKIIRLRRSFGQTAGWSAGFSAATGDIVIVMDADLQNDPEDIPAMIKKLHDEHYDVISGWRKDRKDKNVLQIGSKIGNWVRKKVTGEKIHDQGCSLKVYKKKAL